jgi:multiple sugar transport system ATP-binding protein
MAQVVLDNISKVFADGTRAVDGVSLEISDGEMVVLVGPSGCGKSTALRMVAGLEQMTRGTIRIGNQVVNDTAPKNRDVAMVFQNYALYPHMSVRENLAFGLKLRKTPRLEQQQRVDRAAKMLGIASLLDRKPAALSGGQQQRVALGRAIVREPACFLFDEPLSNLDAKMRVEMRAEIKNLHQRLGATSIYVTHDQEEAMTLGDRLVVMRDGRVQQCGRPLEVYNHPANRFVAGFMGLPPMNFIEGQIVSQETQAYFEDSAFEGSGLRIPLGSEFLRRAGDAITMGIRPAAIELKDVKFESNEKYTTAIRATVDVVEPLGERQDVYLTTEHAHKLIARIDADQTLTVGAEISVLIESQQIHFFEQAGDQQNIALKTESLTTTH